MLAVAGGWKSTVDRVAFWLADHKDDRDAKVSLMQMLSCLCFQCSPPKEYFSSFFSSKVPVFQLFSSIGTGN